jgi:lipopolysaccharide/colanic/teichoic acid biosynthesis glycosyltransferase
MSPVDSACRPQHSARLDFAHQRIEPEANQAALNHSTSASRMDCTPSSYFRVKPFIAMCLMPPIILCALPLLAIVASLIFVMEGRPIFYRQVRVGKNRRYFSIWKFRTMLPNAEKRTGPIWSSKSDVRITRLGKWLRTTHLDELPQVLNVIAGHMHLVGPRPERPEFVESLTQDIPGYERRLLVRPGITGLAQVKQGYDSCVSDVASKVALDVEYIETASLSQDIKIVLMTLPCVASEVWSVLQRRKHSEQRIAPDLATSDPCTASEHSLEHEIHDEITEQLEAMDTAIARSLVPPPKLVPKVLSPFRFSNRT